MAECSALANGSAGEDGGGVGRMADFFWTYVWPVIVIVAQSRAAAGRSLLVAIAYILLADRKIWAAVQMRRGPNVVGPWGLLQSFADLLKFVLKEPVIPAGANKGVFLLAPLVTCVLALAAWAVIPVNARLGDRRHQCRHALHLRHLLARRLRHHHGAAGRRTRNIRSWRRCARPRRWCPTRSRSASSSSPCCCAPARST